MHQRKVSALVALVGTASLGLVVGCGKGAHQEPLAQHSLPGAEEKQVVELRATPAAADVPMPAWLRGSRAGDATSSSTALLTPPVARGRWQGDSLGEPPLPSSLASDTELDDNTQQIDEQRSGFKSTGHVRLARALSPDEYLSGTVSGRQFIADLAAPQASASFAAVEREPTADDQRAATRIVPTDIEKNTLSIVGTTSIVSGGTDLATTETDVSDEIGDTQIGDTQIGDTEFGETELEAAIADVAATETVELADVAAPATEPERAVESPSTSVAELAQATPLEAADEAAVNSPRDVPRLRADLQPLVHPLASATPKRTSPHVKDSSAATEALLSDRANDRAYSYDATAVPSLIAIRELPITKPAADAEPDEAAAETPALAATAPTASDAPESHESDVPDSDVPKLVESQPAAAPTVKTPIVETRIVEAPIVQTKPRIAVPIAKAPVSPRPFAQKPVTPAPSVSTPLAESSIAQRQPAVQQRPEPRPQPAPQQPIARAPIAQQPAAQQPIAQTPLVQAPAARPPIRQQPTVSPAPAPPQVATRPVVPSQLAPNQLARRHTAARSHVPPKRFTAPVVTPHGSVRAPMVRTIPVQRPPVATARPITRPSVSREMLAVRKMADRHTFAGFDFASRRALYSAEAEFISSLRVLSRATDRLTRSREHAAALADGILALKESDDFLASGSELEADFDVAVIVAGHRTTVLQGDSDLEEMTPLVAAQRYYAFAQQRLADAVDGEPSGSFALYGLGKLHGSLAAEPGANPEVIEPKAMVYHQAALMASPVNYMAANELAVLLARYGQLDEARNLLLHSVSIAPQSSTWHNLAVVHAQLGERQLAEAASAEHSIAQSRSAGNPNDATVNPVRWVEPSEFSRTSDQTRSPAASGPTAQAPTITPMQHSVAPVHQAAAAKKNDGGMFGLFKRK